MGVDRALDSTRQAWRAAAHGRCARGLERNLLRALDRLPVARASQGLPAEKTTVYDYLELWNRDGTLARIHHALYVEARVRAGREANPTVAIIDSQSVKGAENGGFTLIHRASIPARSATSPSTRSVSC